jgi:hypothetical protein
MLTEEYEYSPFLHRHQLLYKPEWNKYRRHTLLVRVKRTVFYLGTVGLPYRQGISTGAEDIVISTLIVSPGMITMPG